jgi:hypothetical protein
MASNGGLLALRFRSGLMVEIYGRMKIEFMAVLPHALRVTGRIGWNAGDGGRLPLVAGHEGAGRR